MAGSQHHGAGFPLRRSVAVWQMLGDERHELIADKACLARTRLGHRHPAIDGCASDFQLDALAEDGNDLGVLRRLGAEIDVDRRHDSGSGTERCRRADDWGAGRLRGLRLPAGSVARHRGFHRSRLLRRRNVFAVQASRQEHAHHRPLNLALEPGDTGVGGLTALLESDRELVAFGARFNRAADVTARDRGGRIGIIDSNVDRVLGGEQISEGRVDDRRAELCRNRGERASGSFSGFGTFDGADVDELEGRLRAKGAAATSVDPGWQRLRLAGSVRQRLFAGRFRRSNGRGPGRSAGGGWPGSGWFSHQLPCCSGPSLPPGGAGSVQTDLASGAVRPTVAGDATDGGLYRKRTTVKGLGDAGGKTYGGKHGQPAKTRRRLAR